MERISSRRNPMVKRFRALADGSNDYVLLDGAHLLEDALACGVAVETVAVRDADTDGPFADLVRKAADRGARVLRVAETVLTAISPVRSPSGVVAIARRRPVPIEAALEHAPQLALVLADVQDPGNVGAIVRVADGCGATGVITGGRSADPFGWKALRGSMGSAFRIPVSAQPGLEPALHVARARGIRALAAVPRDGVPLPQCDFRPATAVILGGEGAGVPESLLDLCDGRITIPMRPQVESLNVATAAALILYEALRQREGPAS
ncbi:MAG: TrmH family RNA methyltransferase [Vicinamibacterales bacterium]